MFYDSKDFMNVSSVVLEAEVLHKPFQRIGVRRNYLVYTQDLRPFRLLFSDSRLQSFKVVENCQTKNRCGLRYREHKD